jgi:putative transposase
MRKEKITSGEYYHIYNRGINKQTIFHDRADYARFLFLVLYFQSAKTFYNIGRIVSGYIKQRLFLITTRDFEEIIRCRSLELIAFCIMPNHFHLIIKEGGEGNVAKYMHRVLGGYSRYYNAKYKTSGHLFQSEYKSVLIENNTQLLYLTAYIHRNPRVLPEWYKKEAEYEWSSYQDYIGVSRYADLLEQRIILDQFDSKEKYYEFVESSTAKT